MASPKGKKPREESPKPIDRYTLMDVKTLAKLADNTLTTLRNPSFGSLIRLPSGRQITPARFATVIANSGLRTLPENFSRMELLYDALDFDNPTWLSAQRRVLIRDRSVASSILAYADVIDIDKVLSEYIQTGKINFFSVLNALTSRDDNDVIHTGSLLRKFQLLVLKNKEEDLFRSELLRRRLDKDVFDWVNNHRNIFENVITKFVIDMVRDISSASLSVPPVPHDVFVYKGVTELKKLGKVGDVYTEDKYMSTSRDLNVALSFAKNTLLIIRIPETLKGIAVDQLDGANSNEKEILFQPFSEFVVEGIIENHQIYDEDARNSIFIKQRIKKVYHLTYIGQASRVRAKKIQPKKRKKLYKCNR